MGGLSSREIGRKTRTYIAYVYLAAMEHLSYWTIARFKVEYPDLSMKHLKQPLKLLKLMI